MVVRFGIGGVAVILAAGCGRVVDNRVGVDASVPDARIDAPIDAFVDPFTNGSFEQDYVGWTLIEDSGMPTSGVWGIALDNKSFISGEIVHDFTDNIDFAPGCFNVPPNLVDATDGSKAAFNSQSNPEGHRIHQDLAIPAGASVLLWSMSFRTSSPYDLATQALSIEVRDPVTDLVLSNLFITDPTTAPPPPLDQPMAPFNANISSHAGRTVRITVNVLARSNCLFAVFDDFRIQ